MSRGTFGRAVARAAASGGGRSYRARRPFAWYGVMIVIVILGIGLIAYSRNEATTKPPAKAAEGPSGTDNWHVALALDICGKILPNLPANTNLPSVGIRTFGDGLIDVDPGAVAKPANFQGAKATLGLFVSSYPKFVLTASTLHVPLAGQKTWTNGEACTGGPLTGKGYVTVKTWPSPTAKGKNTATPLTDHLTNNQMITIAFVPKGAAIPEPPSRSGLAAANGTASSTTTTTKP